MTMMGMSDAERLTKAINRELCGFRRKGDPGPAGGLCRAIVEEFDLHGSGPFGPDGVFELIDAILTVAGGDK